MLLIKLSNTSLNQMMSEEKACKHKNANKWLTFKNYLAVCQMGFQQSIYKTHCKSNLLTFKNYDFLCDAQHPDGITTYIDITLL